MSAVVCVSLRLNNNKKLHLKSYEEAAEWFDVHNMSSFKDQMRPVDFHFDLRETVTG